MKFGKMVWGSKGFIRSLIKETFTALDGKTPSVESAVGEHSSRATTKMVIFVLLFAKTVNRKPDLRIDSWRAHLFLILMVTQKSITEMKIKSTIMQII